LPGAADDVHARTSNGQTPLSVAATHEADSAVQLLLQRGADANTRDFNGCTPLMLARSLPVVKLLLAAGADATAAFSIGMTVLHCQASNGACAGTICLLLKAGADPTAAMSMSGTSVTPAIFAGISGHFALEALLSRAEDDCRKKHPAVTGSAVHDSSSSVISSDAAGAVHSDSALSATVSAANILTSDDGKGGVTVVTATASAISDKAGAICNVATEQQQQQQCKQRRVKQPCATCSKPTIKLCRRCAAVHYCSVECQKVCFKDAQHRAQCEAKAAEIV
jgi:Ankyrin repeats (many copies)